MLLHTDLPTRDELSRLLDSQDPCSVSIYVPTEPASDGEAERIAFRNLSAEAIRQLREGDAERAEVAAIEESLVALDLDEEFWRHQARSLAVLMTPRSLATFRLANRLSEIVEVSDRFHVKPLLRARTFPQVAVVLALAQGSVRLIEVEPEIAPSRLRVPDLPSDVASAAGRASITDRAPTRRIQGSEGQKVRMRGYARQVDQALRPFLNGLDVPLVLAATEPIAGIFRSVNSNPHLVAREISGNPEALSDAELAARSREVLDALYAAELEQLRERYRQLVHAGRARADVAEVARAATAGAVETLFADIDSPVTGTLDENSGAVSFGPAGASTYGVVDEIARRVWLTGGRVLAVRAQDIPDGGDTAAILRYALFG
ncbi:MAG TPA: hypothetical protein VFW09_18815 [Solirubrobacteraceae bacterium]|nr:hypothetical protein [Solirubrobacteraceae bacterium]